MREQPAAKAASITFRVPSTFAASYHLWLRDYAPKMVTCGDMEAPFTAVHRSDKFLAVAYVAINAFDVGAFQSAQIALRPQQRLHWIAASEQFVNEVGTDESRCACDEAFHAQNLFLL